MELITGELGGRPISLESGRMAQLASGAVLVRYGETVVLVTATADRREGPDRGFVPLAVHYVEKFYAAGRIPGSFLRREGRLSDAETLSSRFIDRPIRPLFPKYLRCETQVVATVLSTDHENEPSVAAMLGASAALSISDIPFAGPIAGVRVGRCEGRLLINPTLEQRQEGELDFFIAGTHDAILMVEGEAREVSEALALEAILFAHEAMQPIIKMQETLQERVGRDKRILTVPPQDADLEGEVRAYCERDMQAALQVQTKQERIVALDQVTQETVRNFCPEESEANPVRLTIVKNALNDAKKQLMRERILSAGVRVDGRHLEEVRPIQCEVGLLPRCHGSALFTRGETQALVTVTLGARSDEQLIDNLRGVSFRDFLFHYNFPPFSVGEATPLRPPSRREIGHGMLAEKGVSALLPQKQAFPYTLRIASEVLSSNGSSSMASVCGASLALMDAGVPVRSHAAGIAMGLIQEGERTAVLSDILGDEDHLGDMDFKVAGTREGITALQMDIKISGIDRDLLERALAQALAGRLLILDAMEQAISEPRQGLSQYAPRLVALKVNPDRIRDVIGPGGKIIRALSEETGTKIDVNDEGVVTISGTDGQGVENALERVRQLTAEVEIGTVYQGPVRKIMSFGAFVELMPGTDGLVHVSQIRPERVERVEDVLNEGDVVSVRVMGCDNRGKYKLTMIDV